MSSKLAVGLKEGSEMLGISLRKLTYMIQDGEILTFRAGRRVLLAVRDLEAWIDRQKLNRQHLKGADHVQHIEE